jgi:hypothetical protein
MSRISVEYIDKFCERYTNGFKPEHKLFKDDVLEGSYSGVRFIYPLISSDSDLPRLYSSVYVPMNVFVKPIAQHEFTDSYLHDADLYLYIMGEAAGVYSVDRFNEQLLIMKTKLGGAL